ncbi:MAG: hypothetical protein Ta2D_00200 [Rickettsiales bacterium]|nr:MAG: hypothetical protein Ta2D_00200 [Rickettsiales bacterium]
MTDEAVKKFYEIHPTPKELSDLLEKYNPATSEVGKQFLLLAENMKNAIELEINSELAHLKASGEGEKFNELRAKYEHDYTMLLAYKGIEGKTEYVKLRSGFYGCMSKIALNFARNNYKKDEAEKNIVSYFDDTRKYKEIRPNSTTDGFTPQSLITIRNQYKVDSKEWAACDFIAHNEFKEDKDAFAFAISHNYSVSDNPDGKSPKFDMQLVEKLKNDMIFYSKKAEFPPRTEQKFESVIIPSPTPAPQSQELTESESNNVKLFYADRPNPQELARLLEKYDPKTTEQGKQFLLLVGALRTTIKGNPGLSFMQKGELKKFEELLNKYAATHDAILVEKQVQGGTTKDIELKSGFVKCMSALATGLTRNDGYNSEEEKNLVAYFNDTRKYKEIRPNSTTDSFTPQSLITIRSQFKVGSEEWKACDSIAAERYNTSAAFGFAVSHNYSVNDKPDKEVVEKMKNYMIYHSKESKLPEELPSKFNFQMNTQQSNGKTLPAGAGQNKPESPEFKSVMIKPSAPKSATTNPLDSKSPLVGPSVIPESQNQFGSFKTGATESLKEGETPSVSTTESLGKNETPSVSTTGFQSPEEQHKFDDFANMLELAQQGQTLVEYPNGNIVVNLMEQPFKQTPQPKQPHQLADVNEFEKNLENYFKDRNNTSITFNVDYNVDDYSNINFGYDMEGWKRLRNGTTIAENLKLTISRDKPNGFILTNPYLNRKYHANDLESIFENDFAKITKLNQVPKIINTGEITDVGHTPASLKLREQLFSLSKLSKYEDTKASFTATLPSMPNAKVEIDIKGQNFFVTVSDNDGKTQQKFNCLNVNAFFLIEDFVKIKNIQLDEKTNENLQRAEQKQAEPKVQENQEQINQKMQEVNKLDDKEKEKYITDILNKDGDINIVAKSPTLNQNIKIKFAKQGGAALPSVYQKNYNPDAPNAPSGNESRGLSDGLSIFYCEATYYNERDKRTAIWGGGRHNYNVNGALEKLSETFGDISDIKIESVSLPKVKEVKAEQTQTAEKPAVQNQQAEQPAQTLTEEEQQAIQQVNGLDDETKQKLIGEALKEGGEVSLVADYNGSNVKLLLKNFFVEISDSSKDNGVRYKYVAPNGQMPSVDFSSCRNPDDLFKIANISNIQIESISLPQIEQVQTLTEQTQTQEKQKQPTQPEVKQPEVKAEQPTEPQEQSKQEQQEQEQINQAIEKINESDITTKQKCIKQIIEKGGSVTFDVKEIIEKDEEAVFNINKGKVTFIANDKGDTFKCLFTDTNGRPGILRSNLIEGMDDFLSIFSDISIESISFIKPQDLPELNQVEVEQSAQTQEVANEKPQTPAEEKQPEVQAEQTQTQEKQPEVESEQPEVKQQQAEQPAQTLTEQEQQAIQQVNGLDNKTKQKLIGEALKKGGKVEVVTKLAKIGDQDVKMKFEPLANAFTKPQYSSMEMEYYDVAKNETNKKFYSHFFNMNGNFEDALKKVEDAFGNLSNIEIKSISLPEVEQTQEQPAQTQDQEQEQPAQKRPHHHRHHKIKEEKVFSQDSDESESTRSTIGLKANIQVSTNSEDLSQEQPAQTEQTQPAQTPQVDLESAGQTQEQPAQTEQTQPAQTPQVELESAPAPLSALEPAPESLPQAEQDEQEQQVIKEKIQEVNERDDKTIQKFIWDTLKDRGEVEIVAEIPKMQNQEVKINFKPGTNDGFSSMDVEYYDADNNLIKETFSNSIDMRETFRDALQGIDFNFDDISNIQITSISSIKPEDLPELKQQKSEVEETGIEVEIEVQETQSTPQKSAQNSGQNSPRKSAPFEVPEIITIDSSRQKLSLQTQSTPQKSAQNSPRNESESTRSPRIKTEIQVSTNSQSLPQEQKLQLEAAQEQSAQTQQTQEQPAPLSPLSPLSPVEPAPEPLSPAPEPAPFEITAVPPHKILIPENSQKQPAQTPAQQRAQLKKLPKKGWYLAYANIHIKKAAEKSKDREKRKEAEKSRW